MKTGKSTASDSVHKLWLDKIGRKKILIVSFNYIWNWRVLWLFHKRYRYIIN